MSSSRSVLLPPISLLVWQAGSISWSPLPDPQELESQILSLALERAALEAALVGEQGEVRLMRQEAEVQQGEAARLAASLEAVRQEFEDVQLALREEAGEVLGDI